jgi:hypothetical protein
MGGDGTISAVEHLEKEDSENVTRILENMKEKCKKLGCPFPLYFCTDNTNAWADTINKVFPNARVCQDIKHLINRIVEKTAKSSAYYSNFAKEVHGAFCDPDTTVTDRNGKVWVVAGLLKPPAEIIRLLEQIKNNYRILPEGEKLFLKDFDTVFENQKKVITKHVFDPIINNSHVTENTDGYFSLNRGTNRNENFHMTLNALCPKFCGVIFSQELIDCHVFAWNTSHSIANLRNNPPPPPPLHLPENDPLEPLLNMALAIEQIEVNEVITTSLNHQEDEKEEIMKVQPPEEQRIEESIEESEKIIISQSTISGRSKTNKKVHVILSTVRLSTIPLMILIESFENKIGPSLKTLTSFSHLGCARFLDTIINKKFAGMKFEKGSHKNSLKKRNFINNLAAIESENKKSKLNEASSPTSAASAKFRLNELEWTDQNTTLLDDLAKNNIDKKGQIIWKHVHSKFISSSSLTELTVKQLKNKFGTFKNKKVDTCITLPTPTTYQAKLTKYTAEINKDTVSDSDDNIASTAIKTSIAPAAPNIAHVSIRDSDIFLKKRTWLMDEPVLIQNAHWSESENRVFNSVLADIDDSSLNIRKGIKSINWPAFYKEYTSRQVEEWIKDNKFVLIHRDANRLNTKYKK